MLVNALLCSYFLGRHACKAALAVDYELIMVHELSIAFGKVACLLNELQYCYILRETSAELDAYAGRKRLSGQIVKKSVQDKTLKKVHELAITKKNNSKETFTRNS